MRLFAFRPGSVRYSNSIWTSLNRAFSQCQQNATTVILKSICTHMCAFRLFKFNFIDALPAYLLHIWKFNLKRITIYKRRVIRIQRVNTHVACAIKKDCFYSFLLFVILLKLAKKIVKKKNYLKINKDLNQIQFTNPWYAFMCI